MAGFKITGGKGFHITFQNGWTVSVQFGPGNYCMHYDRRIGDDAVACGREGSFDAEVACWPLAGGLATLPSGDSVAGQQSPEDVLGLLNLVASLPEIATALPKQNC